MKTIVFEEQASESVGVLSGMSSLLRKENISKRSARFCLLSKLLVMSYLF